MSEFAIDPRNTVCRDCKGTAVILDHALGELICTDCGLVLEERCFDHSTEWRTFAPEGVGCGNDAIGARVRADAAEAHDINDNDYSLGTSICGFSALAQRAQRLQKVVEQGDRNSKRLSLSAISNDPADAQAAKVLKMEKVIKWNTSRVREVAGRLSLGEPVIRRCVGFMQELAARDRLQQRMAVPYFCALLHLASQQENAFRTVRELAEANVNRLGQNGGTGASAAGAATAGAGARGVGKDVVADFEKQIEKKVRELTKDLNLTPPVPFVENTDLMVRLAGRLQLSAEVAKPASHIAQQAYRVGVVTHNIPQVAVMAAALYMVACLNGVKPKSQQLVASTAGTTEMKFMAAYAVMYPQIRYLMPEELTCPLAEGLQALPNPRGGRAPTGPQGLAGAA